MTVKEIKGVHPTIQKISEALSCEAMTTQNMEGLNLKENATDRLLSPTRLSFAVKEFAVETVVNKDLDTGALLVEGCECCEHLCNVELYKEGQWIMLYSAETELLREAIFKTLSQSHQDTRDLLYTVNF